MEINIYISFNRRIQNLPPQYYVYYAWTDPFKPRKLIVSANGQDVTLELNVSLLLDNPLSFSGSYQVNEHRHPYFLCYLFYIAQ
jgi:hypothetical protein